MFLKHLYNIKVGIVNIIIHFNVLHRGANVMTFAPLCNGANVITFFLHNSDICLNITE